MHKVKLAKDFSRHPAGRFKSDGPYSGQYFREQHLDPYIKRGEQVEVDLDGARGYGSSFLEEAFGGLVRLGNSPENVLRLLRLISNSSALSAEIKKYIVEAGHRVGR